MIRTPPFWYDTDSLRSRILAMALTPASLVYRAGHNLHRWLSKSQHSALPVICCGNLVAGGAGKTPTALAIHNLIIEHDMVRAPVILTRGYGRQTRTPRLVRRSDTDKPDATIIGDEARLLSQYADCIITSDRMHGAHMAERQGYDCIIMDDGLQHMRLSKDFTLCVIDGTNGFGNRRLLPAGPLREPLSSGFTNCDAFVLIGPDHHNVQAMLPAEKPLYRAELAVDTSKLDKHARYIAFCGIGNPDKFRISLENAGLNIDSLHSFADHHIYTDKEIEQLRHDANDKGAKLITTEKDMMRLAATGKGDNMSTLPVHIEFSDINNLKKKLQQITQKK